jgi:hypothetical protein
VADLELTTATRLYAPEAVAAALERISAQGLWLLLSLDRDGWRAEYDAIRLLLDARPGGEEGHFEEHSVLMSIGHCSPSLTSCGGSSTGCGRTAPGASS